MMRLADIFEYCREKYRLHLWGGYSGLTRMVTWFYLAEDLENLSYLREGELIITTGMGYTKDPAWISQVVDLLIERKASGLIINIGKYINKNDLSFRLREKCNKESFPVFLMPWEIHLADLTREISSQLFYLEKDYDFITALFGNLLFEDVKKTEYISQLEFFGFRNDSRYNVLAVANLCSYMAVRSRLDVMGLCYHILQMEDIHSIIFVCPEDQTALDIADAIFAHYRTKRGNPIKDGIPVIGMGEAETSLSKVKFSFQNAISALKIARSENKNFFRFKELGSYQILLSIEDTDLLHRLKREYLEVIEDYDRENDMELLETLETYIQCKGSVNEAASRMFLHRNTVNYRMKKIRELLPFDMDDPDNYFMLKMAFYIHNKLI